MIIGVLSDSHDNIWKIEAAGPHLRRTDAVLHCGDLCAPFVIKRLTNAIGEIPLHVVWGNNDGDRWRISNMAAGFPTVELHGHLARLEVDGLRVAVNHYPDIAADLAASGVYDLVCYGHDHTLYQGEVGSCLLLNPGELMGMNGRSTLAVVDTATRAVEIVEL